MLERARKYMGVPTSPTAPGMARLAEANGHPPGAPLGAGRLPTGLPVPGTGMRRYPGSPLENGMVRFFPLGPGLLF
jgi:hypothetical protein